MFVASTMQHSTEVGLLSRGEEMLHQEVLHHMLHHSGLRNEWVSECLLHQRCNTVLKWAHFRGGKEMLHREVLHQMLHHSGLRNEWVTESLMQHSTDVGLLSRGEEMLHHHRVWKKRVSECLLHR